jgi:molecular chaperone IbpA
LNAIFSPPKSLRVEAQRLGERAGKRRRSYPCCFTEDVAMRTFDFTPYYRSTVGFDRLFDLLDKSVRSDWPPYNIEKKGEDRYLITMTIAGFAPNEIELVQHGSTLQVTGQKGQQPGTEILHQGIPSSFQESFNLADHVKVVGANLEHGLLTIDLVREVPEELKPRRIQIGSGTETLAAKQDNPQKQIDVSGKKAA